MAKSNKTFGINKASRRRQKRKKRSQKLASVTPRSIVHSSEAPVVFQLINQQNSNSELTLSENLRMIVG